MSGFTPGRAAALPGPEWLRRRRAEAAEDAAAMPMPSEKEEVWRYTPIDELRLEDFAPRPGGTRTALGDLGEAFVEGIAADLPGRGALVVACDGTPVALERSGLPDTVRFGGIVGPPSPGPVGGPDGQELLGQVLTDGDVLVRLNDAFHPDAIVLDVPAGVVLEGPVVLVQWCSTEGVAPAPASFPRTVVRLGRGASAEVVEIVVGAPGEGRGLVVPVTELVVGDGAHLAYASCQVLGSGAWHLGRLAAVAGRDSTLRTFTVGLGADYDRSRTDAVAGGAGSTTELRSAYLGTGTQVHDVRTLQDHAAPHTTSDLLCKGAVAGHARSVYSGLIRVRHGAVRTNAFQTNHNLVLDEGAHADSVPNLDIQENDVRCSHASTVGPVDVDQRYYLESRGIPPERAEQLIVLGFFDDIVGRSPVPSFVPRMRREVGLRLAEALALGTGAEDRELTGEVRRDG